MAQIGSRLIDATAGKITDDFFKAFEAHLQAQMRPPRRAGSGPGAAGARRRARGHARLGPRRDRRPRDAVLLPALGAGPQARVARRRTQSM
jgi:hypothetical protein